MDIGRRSTYLVLMVGAGLLVPAGVRAQTSYPMLISVFPLGCRRGATTEVTVSGQGNFVGAYATLFDGEGVKAEIVPPNPEPKPGTAVNSVTLKVTVAPDAPLGVRELRVVTPRGASTVGELVVGTEPEVLEKEGNNTPAEATPITLPIALEGKIQQAEDADWYRFTAKAGQEVAFACLSGRLQDKIHDLNPGSGGPHSDLMLTLTDDKGQELASGDDYWGPDPLLAYRFEKEGTYLLQVRDVRYSGNGGWTYRVACTDRPFVTALYPMAGQRGQSVELHPVGYNLDAMGAPRLELPMRDPGPMELALRAGDTETNPVPFLVSDTPQVLEGPENDTPAGATPFELPVGLNGRIEAENDVDCFRFRGEKGKTYAFEVTARRFGSRLDSQLQVTSLEGAVLANNDDGPGMGKDSRLEWACPADGEYVLQVSDLHRRGGPAFVYTISAESARPDFELKSDDDKALIGPGSGYVMYVLATRRNGFAGEIRLSVGGLPPGVTVTGDRIPAGMTQASLVLHAPPDAKPAFARVRVWGSADVTLPDGTTGPIRRLVRPTEEIYTPGGGRATYPVDTHVVSVTEPSDVLVKVSAARVELKPGESATIDVEVVRQKGYKGNVVLDVYLRHLGTIYGNPLPPGVTLDEGASKTLLGPEETKGKIVLKAAANAGPVENLPIAVLGQVSINFVVKVSHASEPVLLTVKKP